MDYSTVYLRPQSGETPCQDDRWARLEVCDDGPGFPPYFNSHQAANTGLDLVESAARWDLRGDILYENRPQGGACVIVHFPLSDNQG